MGYLPIGKRRHLALAVGTVLGVLISLNVFASRDNLASLPWLPPSELTSSGHDGGDWDVARRVAQMWGNCTAADNFEVEYGKTNLRMSRAYEGVLQRNIDA